MHINSSVVKLSTMTVYINNPSAQINLSASLVITRPLIIVTTDEKEVIENNREIFIEGFRQKANEIYSNSEDLCNCLVDILYDSKANRQFVWDMCGEQMIINLLNKNDNKYTYPVKCNDGDIEWDGIRFTMEECRVC